MRGLSLLLIIVLSTCVSAAEHWALPNPVITPGAINPRATPQSLCARPDIDRSRPALPSWAIELELSSYNIPASDGGDYVLDYLIPLSLGGANTVSNLWPLRRSEAQKKTELEDALRRFVCKTYRGARPDEASDVLANVQRFVAEDWPAAYESYVAR